MEIFGCNNLVSYKAIQGCYKVENIIDLQPFLPCCNLAPCNNLKIINVFM